MRRLLAFAAVALLLPGVPAGASVTKRNCPLVQGSSSAPNGLIAAAELDIVSGDLASGRKTVAVVVRLGAAPGTSPYAALGERWFMQWKIDGVRYAVELARSFSATGGYTYQPTFTAGNTPGGGLSYRVSGTTITWTFPRTLIPALRRTGRVFSDITAGSKIFGGNADQATATETYVDRSPGCIHAD